MNFRHHSQYVGLVLDEMAKIDTVRAVVPNGPGEMGKLAPNVGGRTRLAIQAKSARVLLLFSAPQIQNNHARRQ